MDNDLAKQLIQAVQSIKDELHWIRYELQNLKTALESINWKIKYQI